MLHVRRLPGACLALLVLATVLSGTVALALGILGLLAVLVIAALQIGSLLVARAADSPHPRAAAGPRSALADRLPRVSIHVPCHNEPPELVIATLDALARLDWPDYEVICIDNNTADPDIWRPVQIKCTRLGPRFRFEHFDEVRGAKAGALNIALALSDPSAQYIAVVDADYQVERGFLREAYRYLADRDLSHAQFPQAYRNVALAAGGLAGDYSHYFDVFMPMADRARATLLTGTMLVIRTDVLRAVGGWSSSTITEDAELGARLAVAGYSGCFVPEIVGRGLMPTSLDALRTQRRRWVHGNAATLFGLTSTQWKRLSRAQRIGVVAQLSAWFNGLLIPVALLVLAGALALFDTPSAMHRAAAALAGSAVLIQLCARALVILLAPRRGGDLGTWRTLTAHFGLAWEGATGWLEGLLGIELPFVRTDKFARCGSFGASLPGLVVSLLLAIGGVGLVEERQLLAATGAFAGAAAFAAVLDLKSQLSSLKGVRAHA